MGKKLSDWYISPDIAVNFLLPAISLSIFILAGILLPLENTLQNGDALKIYFAALGFAGVGVILLFLARLPLYRRRRFWTVGPRELDRAHRRLYWSSYLFVLVGLGLLAIVWLRTH